MMNIVLSYQSCMPMNRGSLCPLSTLKSCTKKTNNLCFSTPMLLERKMPCITGSSSSSSSSSLMASPHPLMMIPSSEKDEDGSNLCCFYDYVNKEDVNTNIKIPEEVDDAICVGSSHGWLAYISRRDCSVFLWNPLTTSPLIYLPPIHTLPFITVIPREELDEEDSRDVLEIVDGDPEYNTRKSAYESDDDFSPDFGFKVESDRHISTWSPKRLSLNFIGKIVLSSVPTSDDCIVMAMPRIHGIEHRVAFCKPGDKSWTSVKPVPEYLPIVDVMHFKDQLFYALSFAANNLYAYDLTDFSSPKSYLVETSFVLKPLSTVEESTRKWCVREDYLVESLGDILWVCRYVTRNMNGDGEFIFDGGVEFPTETVTFDVYMRDFSQNTWEYTECIGDQVLFLGAIQSLSLSAQDFPSLKANSIYFTDDFHGRHGKYPPYGGHDYGHYELGGFVFGEFGKFGDGKVLPPPFWVMRHFR